MRYQREQWRRQLYLEDLSKIGSLDKTDSMRCLTCHPFSPITTSVTNSLSSYPKHTPKEDLQLGCVDAIGCARLRHVIYVLVDRHPLQTILVVSKER